MTIPVQLLRLVERERAEEHRVDEAEDRHVGPDAQIERQARWRLALVQCWQDIRYSGRTLTRRATLALVAVLALGLAVGGNVAIFGLIDALFLRPLPVAAPNELVRLQS